MGRNQIYRGDPQQKVYYLVDDFSGGLNTFDVDGVVKDNEFRKLVNVELSKKGLLQNRKGFKHLDIFDKILEENLLQIDKISHLFKIVKDEHNLIQNIIDFSELSGDLEDRYELLKSSVCEEDVEKELVILFFGVVGEEFIGIATLTITFSLFIDEGYELRTIDATISLKDDLSLPSINELLQPTITQINTVDFGDKIYFSLTDIVKTLSGVAVYDVSDGTYDVIDEDNAYKPTPYEMFDSNDMLGFNVISKTPLTNISLQTTSLKAIYPPFLTTIDVEGQKYIKNIPMSGNFELNVIYTGQVSPYELEITLKNQGGEPLAYALSYVSQAEGIIKYGFEGVNIQGLETATMLYIDIEKKLPKIEVFDGNLSPIFLPKGVGSQLEEERLLYIKDIDKFFYRTNVASGSGLLESDYTEVVFTDVRENANPSSADYDILFEEFKNENFDRNYFLVYNSDGDKVVVVYIHSFNSFFKYYNNTILRTFDSFENVVPKLKQTIIKDVDNNKYYYFNTITPSVTFTEITSYNETELVLSILEQRFDIGNVDPIEIVGVDLNGVKLLEIKNRLVYYKGNTIWYSANFIFDYLPLSNYILLPIPSDDEITSINFFRGSYIIFTKNRIYKIKGTFGTGDLEVQLVSDFVGCISPKSVRAIENSLYFMSKQGLYRLVLNYFVETMENVQKIDTKIVGLIPIRNDFESFLYNGQYWLTTKGYSAFDTIKQYYNIELANKNHPFSLDIYAKKPDLFLNNNMNLLAFRNGKMFIYDSGYTDFYDDDTEDIVDYVYQGEIETSALSFQAPTHDKKYKSLYFKTFCDKIVPLYITVSVDGYVKVDPKSYNVSVNSIGEVEYAIVDDENMSLRKPLLSNFELGLDRLGDSDVAVHKLLVSEKGKEIKINIKFKTYNYFGLSNLGIIYKLGKIKENR